MAKENIKEKLSKNQNGRCSLSGQKLSDDHSLTDTDRINPKYNGGIYTDDNTRIVDPVAHMKRHGNYRVRMEQLEKLKTLMDGREQLRKHYNSCNNRMLAMTRNTDVLDEPTLNFLMDQSENGKKELAMLDRKIKKHIGVMSKEDKFVESAMNIKGLGEVSLAYLLVYIDITKANHASSLWKYCGYHAASHERYKKTVSGGGNKTLRTALYAMAESMIKTRSVYRDIYDREKEKLSVSEKITKSYNTRGKLIECAWKDTKPCHRHYAAIRKMNKIFLAHVWHVWRTYEGLPTNLPYVQEKLGHTGIIEAKEMGWEY